MQSITYDFQNRVFIIKFVTASVATVNVFMFTFQIAIHSLFFFTTCDTSIFQLITLHSSCSWHHFNLKNQKSVKLKIIKIFISENWIKCIIELHFETFWKHIVHIVTTVVRQCTIADHFHKIHPSSVGLKL